uniref:Uncharacterized protein LOC117350578 n=1 Tax=Geotrypetes seraphini TaxID=260995 RepID=A0A6P8Q0I3_GEOSA|nr:uncharacterized protein LOC117350578 [Geotrypetes seraphini]XP_033780810.1 uncharacterized protein LOC117350578 [Geotrypetes seraphini]XP_033780811.1 uncharacterized protein LOC117350578 [Geotrypetes seraphini]
MNQNPITYAIRRRDIGTIDVILQTISNKVTDICLNTKAGTSAPHQRTQTLLQAVIVLHFMPKRKCTQKRKHLSLSPPKLSSYDFSTSEPLLSNPLEQMEPNFTSKELTPPQPHPVFTELWRQFLEIKYEMQSPDTMQEDQCVQKPAKTITKQSTSPSTESPPQSSSDQTTTPNAVSEQTTPPDGVSEQSLPLPDNQEPPEDTTYSIFLQKIDNCLSLSTSDKPDPRNKYLKALKLMSAYVPSPRRLAILHLAQNLSMQQFAIAKTLLCLLGHMAASIHTVPHEGSTCAPSNGAQIEIEPISEPTDRCSPSHKKHSSCSPVVASTHQSHARESISCTKTTDNDHDGCIAHGLGAPYFTHQYTRPLVS